MQTDTNLKKKTFFMLHFTIVLGAFTYTCLLNEIVWIPLKTYVSLVVDCSKVSLIRDAGSFHWTIDFTV